MEVAPLNKEPLEAVADREPSIKTGTRDDAEPI